MKKFTLVAALMVLLCGTALSAKDFDWSKSWCNYGAGIEEGNFIVNVDLGLNYSDLSYSGTAKLWDGGFWFIPPVLVEVQYAKKIWKLPFTFGGYAGIHGFGYKAHEYYNYHYDRNIYRYVYDTRDTKPTVVALYVGGEIAYHAMLPVDKLDVYVATKIGADIPLVKKDISLFGYNYFTFGEAIGANYFFTDKVGANLEIGYPFTKIGLTLKF